MSEKTHEKEDKNPPRRKAASSSNARAKLLMGAEAAGGEFITVNRIQLIEVLKS